MALESLVLKGCDDPDDGSRRYQGFAAILNLLDARTRATTEPYGESSRTEHLQGWYDYAGFPSPTDAWGTLRTSVQGLRTKSTPDEPTEHPQWEDALSAILANLGVPTPIGVVDYEGFFNPLRATVDQDKDFPTLINNILTDASKASYKVMTAAEVDPDLYEDLMTVSKNASETLSDSVSEKGVAQIAATEAELLTQAKLFAAGVQGKATEESLANAEAFNTSTFVTGTSHEVFADVAQIKTDTEADVSALLTKLSIEVKSLVGYAFTEAVSAAVALIGTTPYVTNLVDAFESDTVSGFMRDLNLLDGGFADINAVNSSAFAFAQVMLVGDRRKEINKYRAQVTNELFNRLWERFVETFRMVLLDDLKLIQEVMLKRLEAYEKRLGKRLETFVTLFTDYVKSAVGVTSELSQVHRTSIASQGQVYQSVLVSQLDALKTALSGHLNNYMNERIHQKDFRNSLLAQSLTERQQVESANLTHLRNSVMMDAEAARMFHAAKLEAWSTKERYLTEGRLWSIKKWQYLANTVAAAGGGVMIPDKPDQWQSLISGILMGAEAGAKIGAGTDYKPYTSIVGGILGGIGGAQGY